MEENYRRRKGGREETRGELATMKGVDGRTWENMMIGFTNLEPRWHGVRLETKQNTWRYLIKPYRVYTHTFKYLPPPLTQHTYPPTHTLPPLHTHIYTQIPAGIRINKRLNNYMRIIWSKGLRHSDFSEFNKF